MKVIVGRNAILYNVSFENIDDPLVCDGESFFGYKKPTLRIRFASWLFGFIVSGKIKSGPNMTCCTITGSDEANEKGKEEWETFLKKPGYLGSPLHDILRRRNIKVKATKHNG